MFEKKYQDLLPHRECYRRMARRAASGPALIGTPTIIFAPIVHRELNGFHIEDSTLD